jgi:hypothetical protein
VEQQGKTIDALNAQLYPDFWEAEQAKVEKIDKLIKASRA